MKKLLLIIFALSIVQLHGQTWEQIGPNGGYFKEFSFHPNNASIVYAGSDDGGGIWKSLNGGQDWDLLTPDFTNMTGWSITIDQQNPDTVFACDVYGRYGLLKSTDGGASWNQSVTGLSSQYDRMVSGITLKTTDTLFISTGEGKHTTPPRPGNGVFKSVDGGSSWSPAGLQGQTVLSIGSNVFGTIFAGTESNGLQFSNDNGTTWSHHPQVSATSVVYEVDVMEHVIVVSSSTGVYLSVNWGIDFINTGLAGEFNFDVAIQQTSPTIELWGTTFSGLQKYSSSTSTWVPVSDPLLDNKLVIGIGASGTNVMIGTFSNGPIYLSNNSGTSWSTTATSPTCTEINDLIVDPNNSDRMFTCLLGTYNLEGLYNDQCIYETSNAGSSWTRKGPNAHALCLTPNPLDFNKSYLGTFSQGLFKSNDGFDNSINILGGKKLIGDVAVSSEDTSIVIISEIDLNQDPVQATIKRSTNGGNTFAVVSSATTNRLIFNDSVYAATTNGVFLSVDFGLTWNAWHLNGSNVLSLGYFHGTLYAGTSTGQLHKINGESITDVSGNWELPVQIKSIYQLENNLFVGLNGAEQDTTHVLNGGMWTSPDEGISWSNITGGMTSTNVYGNNVINSRNNNLLVATYGGGIFESSNVVLGINETDHKVSSSEITPNPAESYVTIHSKAGNIMSYVLVDLMGNIVVSEKVKGTLSSEVSVNLLNIKSGVYTVLIKLDNNETISNKIYKQ